MATFIPRSTVGQSIAARSVVTQSRFQSFQESFDYETSSQPDLFLALPGRIGGNLVHQLVLADWVFIGESSDDRSGEGSDANENT